jgi:hypothetical protein
MKYQNTQFHNECQMVAVMNALRFWNMPYFKPKSRMYRLWARILGGKTEIGCNMKLIKKFVRLAGLKGIHRRGLKRSWMKQHLPIAVSLEIPGRGFHDVLIVDMKRKGCLVANYAHGRLHWLPWRKINAYYTLESRTLSLQPA